MNIKRYAHEYAKFHNSFTFDLMDDLILLPFTVWTWDNSKVLRLRYFDKIKSNNCTPLAQALKAYLKTDTICSVFLSKDTCSLLIGNERLIIPESRGSLKLCATSFFVRDPKIIESHASVSRTPFPNVFVCNIIENAILFLDELDVPCPGGNYFNNKTGSEYYRLCYLTTDPKVLQSSLKIWRDHDSVITIPFFSKSATINVSNFLHIQTINDVPFPDSSIKSTAIIDKKNPHFLIQDILNTYVRNGGFIDNIGLFIEYPIRVSFEGCDDIHNDRLKQFIAISINGNEPKTVLHVQCPYDRYIEYTHIPAVPWTRLLFDTSDLPSDLQPVVVDSTILGYNYQDAFFCLSYPMLDIKFGNFNTEYLLNTVDFDLYTDKKIDVIDSYRYDNYHDINRVKHRELPHELWCLTTIQNIPETYARRVTAPEFVRNWLLFYDQNKQNKDVRYGDLDVVKLALVLARHKICFSLKASRYREVFFEQGKDILFRLDPEAIDFINDVRLDDDESRTDHELSGDKCIIL